MKFDINRLKLKWKVFGFLLGFCGLLLLILWLFQTVFLESFYRSIKISDVKKTGDSISQNIDSKNLSDYISTISQNNDVCIDILSPNGESIVSSDYSRDCVIHKMSISDKQRLIESTKNNGGEFYEYLSIEPPKKPDKLENFYGKNLRAA